MKRKPTPDMEKIRASNKLASDDPEARFREQLHAWGKALIDGGEIPRAAISLDMMSSAFSAFEVGLEHQDISEGYPVRGWREDTVEVPRAWVRELVTGWRGYKDAPFGTTFGEALKLEGGGQGKSPVRRKFAKLKKSQNLSNAVVHEYLANLVEEGKGSQERAIETVAENEGVSVDTAKRAFDKFGRETIQKMEQLGLMKKGGKTS